MLCACDFFAEQLQGVFRNNVITFSSCPRFIDLKDDTCLKDKLEIMLSYSEVANTNIEAVFDLILEMAKSNDVPANEIPKQVLVISDMEFDSARFSKISVHRRCHQRARRIIASVD